MSLHSILETVDGVFSVLEKVASTPGLNALPYITNAASAVTTLRAAYAAEKNIEPYVAAIQETYQPGAEPPSQEKRDALDAKLADLEIKSDEPLPAKEEGEED